MIRFLPPSVRVACAAAALLALPVAALGQAGPTGYAGAAVTVVKAKRSCFADALSITGMIVPREEAPVRPDREGLKITELLVDAGDIVAAGQAMARLLPPDAAAGSTPVTLSAPVTGLVLKADGVIGAYASLRAPPLFQILARNEVELQGELPAAQLAKMSLGQEASIAVVGVGEVKGRVRTLPATVDGATQLGQVRIFIGSDARLRIGAFARAQIVGARSCNLSVPLSAVLYGGDTAFVAVVRGGRIETRQVAVGQLAEGEAEIKQGLAEGDLVVARAGAFFREGDRVRPFLDGAPAPQR